MTARPIIRFLAVLILVLAASAPAAHARVFVSFGFPFFPFWGPAYYPPSYYYPPPYPYYPPQQSYYAPNAYAPNAYAPPAAQSAPAQTVSPSASKNCRTYHGDATIDSSGKPFYGRACRGDDGLWHVVP